MFQQMGFGLAVAILIDATVVRTIIVPAAMELLGDWNWYLPRWLEWLPNVSVEGHAYEPPAPKEQEPIASVASPDCHPRGRHSKAPRADDGEPGGRGGVREQHSAPSPFARLSHAKREGS